MLRTALTPQYARALRSRRSASRVVLRWTCVSTIIGITVLPLRSTRLAPEGTRASAAAPACASLAPSTTSVAFSTTRPSPTMRRAPSYAVTWANAGIADPTRRTAAANAAIRRMGTPGVMSSVCGSIAASARARLIAPWSDNAISRPRRCSLITAASRPIAFETVYVLPLGPNGGRFDLHPVRAPHQVQLEIDELGRAVGVGLRA